MTAAIAELAVSILPSMEGMAESFGSAGGMAGTAMGAVAGEMLTKHLVKHGKQAGADAGSEAAKAFNESMETGALAGDVMRKVGEDAFKGLGGKVAETFMSDFNKVVSGKGIDLSDVVKPFQMLENMITAPIMNTIGKIPLLGAPIRALKDTFDTATASASVYMQTLIDIGTTYTEVARTIASSTVDSTQLEGLTSGVRDIMASGAIVHLDDVASAIGRLNTNIGNLSSEQLKELTTNFATLEELVGKVDPTKFAGVINAWGIGGDAANETLTQLGNTARITGVDMNKLMSEMEQVGPSMRAFGYSAQQTATFFASMAQQGLPAQRAVFMWTKAFSEATKAGEDPKTWLETQLTAIKQFAAAGDMQAAAEAFEKAFGQRGTPLMLEDIKRGLIDIPALMKPLAGIDEPLSKGIEETKSLGDAFEVIGHQISAALEPIGLYLAKGLVSATGSVTTWLAENQDKVVHWGIVISDWILTAAGDLARFMGDSLLMVSGILNPLKEMVAAFFGSFLSLITLTVDALAELPLVGHLFEGAKRTMNDTMEALHKIDKVDLGHIASDFGHQLQHLGDVTIPGVKSSLDRVGGQLESNLKVSEAFSQEINGELKPAFDQIKDASGQLIAGDAEHPALRLLGKPEQWADIKNKLHEMGIEIQTSTTGVVSKIEFANKEAHDTWDKWYEEAAKKGGKSPMVLEPKDKNNKDVTDTGDLVQPGSADVTLNPKYGPGTGVVLGPGGVPMPEITGPTSAIPTAPSPAAPAMPTATGAPIRLPSGAYAPMAPGGPASYNTLPANGSIQSWLSQQLVAAGLSPDEAKGILAMNLVEGGAADTKSLLGFTEGQASGPEGHLQAFLQGQWNDAKRRGPGGSIPGVEANGTVTDWNQYMTWIREKIVGQTGSPSDWEGNAQPAPQDYQNRLLAALGQVPAITPPAAPTSPTVIPLPAPPGSPTVIPLPTATAPATTVPLPVATAPPPTGAAMPTLPGVAAVPGARIPVPVPATTWSDQSGWGYYKVPVTGEVYWVPQHQVRPDIPAGGHPEAPAGYEWVTTKASDGGSVQMLTKKGDTSVQPVPPLVTTPPSTPGGTPTAPGEVPTPQVAVPEGKPGSMSEEEFNKAGGVLNPPMLPPGAKAWFQNTDRSWSPVAADGKPVPLGGETGGHPTGFVGPVAGEGTSAVPENIDLALGQIYGLPEHQALSPQTRPFANEILGTKSSIWHPDTKPGSSVDWYKAYVSGPGGPSSPGVSGFFGGPQPLGPYLPGGSSSLAPMYGPPGPDRYKTKDVLPPPELTPSGPQPEGSGIDPRLGILQVPPQVPGTAPSVKPWWWQGLLGGPVGLAGGGWATADWGPLNDPNPYPPPYDIPRPPHPPGWTPPGDEPWLWGADVGGGVPWMPGTRIGEDGVHAILAPDEHVWTAAEVAMAGGHQAMYAMRAAALNGHLHALGGPIAFQGGGAAPGTGVTPLNTTGAQIDTIAIGYAVEQAFGITNQDFYASPDGYNEHSSGEAVDIIVGAGNDAVGNAVKDFAIANAAAYGVQYALWHQTTWNPDGSSSPMENRGSPTQNHMDHVHIRTAGGGFPPGAGPGSGGVGSYPSGTSAQPAPAGAMLLGSGSLPAPSAGAPGATPGTPGAPGTVGPTGQTTPGYYNPWTAMPSGLTAREQATYTAQYEQWQQSQIKATEAVTNTGKDLANAQTAQATALAQSTAARTAYDAEMARDDTPEKQAAFHDKLAKLAKDASDKQEAYNKATDAVTTAWGRQTDAVNEQTIKSGELPPKPPGKTGTGAENMDANALGKGLVKGIFQELGFPDVFGKPFTEWGISKLLSGGATYGMGLLQNMGQAPTGMFAGGALPESTGSVPSGILGGMFPDLAKLFQGNQGKPGIDQPFSPSDTTSSLVTMPPSQAPANVPVGAPGGPGMTVNINNDGVMAPQHIDDTVKGVAHRTDSPQVAGGAPLATVP